ncbi:hypothetical protein [Streptomyces sp. JJ36]|uniref:hypothetical protein n=1 Tax=Streptomyces sp. JJ36 TaxID=2736645 RepID=UPI001F403BC6|nr:hypothetical protein [Streptomyces sp. JJ36]MCF6523783.1 hypothetical protein [Streptomyces sp. JJ36]
MAQSCGQWWDAVKANSSIGDRALAALGDANGAVIRDNWSHYLYWLVPCRAADDWVLNPASALTDPSYVRIIGTAGYVAVPGRDRLRGDGVYWARPYRADHCLTDPELLRLALQDALDQVLGEHVTA